MEMKILSKVAEHQIKKKVKDVKKQLVKARPSVKKQKEEEKKKEKEKGNVNPKQKYLSMWVDKLENMHIILTAEDAMSNYSYLVILLQICRHLMNSRGTLSS